MSLKKRSVIAGILFLILNSWSVSGVKAQNMDSLENVLKHGRLTLDKQLNIYDELSWGYLSSNISSSLDYGKQGLHLADKMKDAGMVAVFNRNIGVAYYMASRYDSASNYLEKALDLAKKQKDKPLEARVHFALGNLYSQMSDYQTALESYLKTLAMFEELGNRERLPGIYHNIGSLYQRLNNHAQALINFDKSIALAKETGNVESEGFTLMAMSNIYMEKDHEEAIRLSSRAKEIFRETGNLYNEIMAVLTIAQSHYKAENYSLASDFANRGLKLAKQTDYPKLVAEAEGVISNIHFYQGKYEQSEIYALSSLEKDSSDVNLSVNMMSNIVRSNIFLGNPDKALRYLDKYRDWMETFANSSYQGSLSEMEIKYETEKKELKIKSLEKEKQLYTGWGITIVVLLITALAFFVIRHRLAVSKRKLAEQQMRQLEQEKQLIAVQAALDGESAERSRLARDLHDGLGSMLSVVKFNLPEMKSGVLLEAADVRKFQKALGMLDDSILELRRVAHHMMPESLLRFGLKASISDFCQAIPNVNFHYYGNEARLPEKLEIMIYRSVHELVNNALKHAQATQISVQLIQEPERVSFTVQDDGIGFDPATSVEGMGLKNIRKRIDVYQGKMDIFPSDQGTEIHIEIDLNS